MGEGGFQEGGSKVSKRIRSVVAIAAVGVLTLAVAPSPTLAAKARIKATSSRNWSPEFKHVRPGTRVIWKNPTGTTHTVTAYGGGWSKNSTVAANGGRTSKRFRKEGAYRYRCTRHSTLIAGDCDGMCAVIHVADY